MNTIQFEWDNNKNAINKKKHKISFEEASTVFYDDRAILFDDPEHSSEEESFNYRNHNVIKDMYCQSLLSRK